MKFRPSSIIPALVSLVASPAHGKDFIWKGTTDSVWATATNWGTAASPFVPVYGTTYTADRLVIGNGAGAGAIYNPGTGVTTNFGNGRGLVIGQSGVGDGALTVSSGTLDIDGTSSAIMANAQNAALVINGGTLDLTGNNSNFVLIFNAPAPPTVITSTLTISSGSFLTNQKINLDLANAGGNTGNGTINLDGGTFSTSGFIRSSTAGTGTSKINFNGALLKNTGTVNNGSFLNALTNTTVTVKSGGALIDSGAVDNTNDIAIAANLLHDATLGATLDGGLTKSGGSTLTLSGNNTFTGGTIVNAGQLKLNHSSGAGTGGITLANTGAQLNVGGGTNIANSLTVSGTGDQKSLRHFDATASTYSGGITINEESVTGFTVNIGSASGGLNVSGVIDGTGAAGLTKQGSGSLTLSNTNTYTGATTVSAGTLFVTGALGNSAVSVATNGTIGGSGAIAGTLTFDAGANLDLTGATIGLTSTGILSVATNKAITLNGFNFTDIIGWDYANAALGTYTLINGGSSVTFGGATPISEATAFDFGNGKKGYFQQGSLQAVIIPEPGAALLGGLGVLALLRRRRA